MIILRKFLVLLKKSLLKFGIGIHFSSDGEDAIINKWLSGIKKGFYIDIGAHKPLFSSNTFGLYLNGWKGICIDPNPGLKLKYSLLRSSDIFLNSAIVFGNDKKNINFYHYKNNTDLNTFSQSRVRIQKKLYNRIPTKILKVKIININELTSLINKKVVHFLNIDVEGLEDSIVKSLLNKKIFPWCIAIEELGKTCEVMNKSKIKKFLNLKGYFLASKTFLTSIYIRKDVIKKLPSKYVKEIRR
jgi:FkbM family methyltransferase